MWIRPKTARKWALSGFFALFSLICAVIVIPFLQGIAAGWGPLKDPANTFADLAKMIKQTFRNPWIFWPLISTTLLLTGFTFGLWSDEFLRNKEAEKYKETASKPIFVRTVLRLRFSGEMESPQAIYAENILDWFIYWTPSFTLGEQNGGNIFFHPPTWALFINFKEPSDYHQIVVNFSGSRPNTYEVRRNLTTSAIITLDGPMLASEMEIINTLQPSPSAR